MSVVDHDRQVDLDAQELQRLGYKQELKRTLDLFANFAVAFCYISPVVGIFAVFSFGLQTGGPAFVWGAPLVLLGQILVSLVFAEVGSEYPLAGSLFQWAKKLLGPTMGWFTGWVYGWALLVTIAAVDFGGAPYVASLLGLDGSSHAVLVAITLVMLAIQTGINIIGVRRMALLTNLGVMAEIAGTLGLGVILLLFFRHQPVSVLFDTAGVEGTGPYWPLFLTSTLFAAWIFYGFESAGDVAEEVINPGVRVPKAIVSSITVAGIVSVIATIAFVLAIPDMSVAMDPNTSALNYIIESNLPAWASPVFQLIIVFGFFSCGLAIQAAATRLIYSYARDRMIPFSGWLARVHSTLQTPVNALIFSAVFTALVSLWANAVAIIVNFATVGIYLSFQVVVLSALIARMRGWRPGGKFTLGRWGTLVNIIALLFGVGMVVNLCRPNTAAESFASRWIVLLCCLVVVVGGLIFYAIYRPTERMRQPDQSLAAD